MTQELAANASMMPSCQSRGQRHWPQDRSISPDASAFFFASFLSFLLLRAHSTNVSRLTAVASKKVLSHHPPHTFPVVFGWCGGQTCHVWLKVVPHTPLAAAAAATDVKS